MTLKKLAELSNFLGSWFPDADLDGLTDEEVVAQFVGAASAAELAAVRRQLDELLASGTFDPEEIGNEANRFFSTPAECEAWLQEISRALADACPAQ